MISFVVPAFNEEASIARTLAALQEAATSLAEPFEILVVDDASSDRTAGIAEHCGARVIAVSHRHIAATRNAGARAARGELLLFVDADTLVNSAVVRAAVAAMRAGAVGGGALVSFDEPIPAWARRVLVLLRFTMRTLRWAAGCFLFCTRAGFDAVGGFDQRFYGAEEIVMSRALKRVGRFVVLRESVVSSGRKMRMHSGREILATIGGLVAGGRRSLRDRRALDHWYRPRREDPAADPRRRSA